MSLVLHHNPPLRPSCGRHFFSTPLIANEEFFQLDLNVGAFKPEEIYIELSENNVLTVEGKHEEKKDENGSISRHFVKKSVVPSDYDLGKIQSFLYANGVLRIWAPKIKGSESRKSNGWNIPVTRVKGGGSSLKSKL